MEKREIREQKLDAKPISSAQYQVPSSLSPPIRVKRKQAENFLTFLAGLWSPWLPNDLSHWREEGSWGARPRFTAAATIQEQDTSQTRRILQPLMQKMKQHIISPRWRSVTPLVYHSQQSILGTTDFYYWNLPISLVWYSQESSSSNWSTPVFHSMAFRHLKNYTSFYRPSVFIFY